MNSIEKATNYIKENFKNVNIVKLNKHQKFSVNGKIFAIIYTGNSPHIILKANGLFNKELRKEFKNTVMPSYTINSYHWNMILFDMEMPDYIINRLISNSHDEVVKNMTRRQKDTYDHILKTF